MKEIRTEILIKTEPGKVWERLIDFSRYPEWNPFIASIDGRASAGKTIQVKMMPPGAQTMIFKPKVLRFIPNKELRWLGHFIFPGWFDGEHIFELVDNKDGSTLFIQREMFSGILVLFLRKMLDDNTKRGFEMMNRKLKAICEFTTGAGPSILQENLP